MRALVDAFIAHKGLRDHQFYESVDLVRIYDQYVDDKDRDRHDLRTSHQRCRFLITPKLRARHEQLRKNEAIREENRLEAEREATRREAAKKAKAQQQEKDRVEREKKKQDAHDKIIESLKSQNAGLTKEKGQLLDENVHLKEDNNRLRQILIDNGIEYPERGATSSSPAQGGGSGALSERDVATRAGQNRSPGKRKIVPNYNKI